MLLNMYIRACSGEDITSWQDVLGNSPVRPVMRPCPTVYSDMERSMGVLSLLCRGARHSDDYRALLGVAVHAGLASDRQATWIMDSGLLAKAADRLASGQP